LTELGMVIDDILVHVNTYERIFSNPSLKVILDRLKHFSNPPMLISFTELGITIDFILVHSNALAPISSNPSLRVT